MLLKQLELLKKDWIYYISYITGFSPETIAQKIEVDFLMNSLRILDLGLFIPILEEEKVDELRTDGRIIFYERSNNIYPIGFSLRNNLRVYSQGDLSRIVLLSDRKYSERFKIFDINGKVIQASKAERESYERNKKAYLDAVGLNGRALKLFEF